MYKRGGGQWIFLRGLLLFCNTLIAQTASHTGEAKEGRKLPGRIVGMGTVAPVATGVWANDGQLWVEAVWWRRL